MSKTMINLDEIDAIINKHKLNPVANWSLEEECERSEKLREQQALPGECDWDDMTEIVWDMDEQIMERYEDEMSRQDLDNAVINNSKGEV